ncbi:peptide-methionine (S)-S-oxide reductase MsrA [Leptospira ryugenii]|nr:peptide-methionine (S)-S-oxide reductase MsrA [Leptospira ryugenii]
MSEVATIGGGCFWCLEAVYLRIPGIQSVVSGYAGGKTDNPTYKEICTGTTGHAEVIQITFDPKQISFNQVLDIFWHAHDPTTLNRQGNDVGTQYRSIILFHNEEQKSIAEKSKQEFSYLYPKPIVTEITELRTFYPAESYHQNYFENNPNNPYCNFIILPKLQKLGLDGKGITS